MRPEVQTAVREVVIVDPACESYGEFVQAAHAGRLGVHFCVDGRSAARLARRFRADVWLVAGDLPDMSGFDLLPALAHQVSQGDVDPLREGSRMSLDRIGRAPHAGIFIVSDSYRVEDERRALASGVAGYLVRPVSFDLVQLGSAAASRTVSADPKVPVAGVSVAEPEHSCFGRSGS